MTKLDAICNRIQLCSYFYKIFVQIKTFHTYPIPAHAIILIWGNFFISPCIKQQTRNNFTFKQPITRHIFHICKNLIHIMRMLSSRIIGTLQHAIIKLCINNENLAAPFQGNIRFHYR